MEPEEKEQGKKGYKENGNQEEENQKKGTGEEWNQEGTD
jgi:hypothetical protein